MSDEKIGYQPEGTELNINKLKGCDLNINPPPAVAPDNPASDELSPPGVAGGGENVNPSSAVAPEQYNPLKIIPKKSSGEGENKIFLFDVFRKLMTRLNELELEDPDKFSLIEKLLFESENIPKKPKLPDIDDPDWAIKIRRLLYEPEEPPGLQFLRAIEVALEKAGFGKLSDLLSKEPLKTKPNWRQGGLPQTSGEQQPPTAEPTTPKETVTDAKKSLRKIEITPEDLANANAYLSQIKDYLRGQSLGQSSSQSDQRKTPP